jgi:hypothetical protein
MSEQSERLTRGSGGHHFEDSPLTHQRSVRVVRRDELSDDTKQTSGLLRRVAFDSRNPDAQVLSAFLSGLARNFGDVFGAGSGSERAVGVIVGGDALE